MVNHHYKISVSGTNWHKLQEDGRWFFMRSSMMRHTNKVKKKLVNALGHIPASMTLALNTLLAKAGTLMHLHASD